MGRLFDESGQGLTPSHAVKGERRYRYYVSRSLIKGTADTAGCSWRLPAPEIERIVAAAVGQILSDRTGIVAAAQAIGLADNRLPSLFSAAAEWRENLQSEVEAGATLSALIDRIDLAETGIRVSLRLPIPETASPPAADANGLIIARFFPMTVRRRGVEMRLVIEGNRGPAPRADSAFLKAVARARQWSEDLLADRARSVAEIAERERVGSRYVRRLLRLAFLVPDIVEAIAAGYLPPALTAEALAERIDLSLLGTAQAKAVGIAS
jgi:site-specific DNA recombinase